MKPVIKLEDIRKTYQTGEVEVKAVGGVSLEILQGEFVALMGASGSGKSTMMNTLGCLDRPTGGKYFLDGIDISQHSEPGIILLERCRGFRVDAEALQDSFRLVVFALV